MSALPINVFHEYFPSRIDVVLYRPHTQIRIILFDGVRRDIPNSELFFNHVLIELSRIAFSHNSPAK